MTAPEHDAGKRFAQDIAHGGAFAVVPFFTAAVLMLAASAYPFTPPFPVAGHGVLDLSSWPLTDDRPAPLKGEWEFYWGALHSPETFAREGTQPGVRFVVVPHLWAGMDFYNKESWGNGTATYRLRVMTPAACSTTRALDITQAISAYRLWVNGKPAGTQGAVSDSPGTFQAGYNPHIIPLRDTGPELDIVIHVQSKTRVRFQSYFSPGLWPDIHLGPLTTIARTYYLSIGMQFFILGCLFMILLYYSVLALSRREPEYWYFSAICTCMILWQVVVPKNLLLMVAPGLSPDIYLRFWGLCLHLLSICIVFFGRQIFPREFSTRLARAMLIPAAVSAAAILISADTFSWDLLAFMWQVTIIINILHIITGVVLAMIRRREESALLAGALFILGCTGIYDVFFPGSPAVPLAMPGMLVLLICQSVALALRHARAQDASRRHQTELAHAEKLVSLGTLVGAVAHEINNPNNAIMLGAQTQERTWQALWPILDEYAEDHGEFSIGGYLYGEIKEEMGDSIRRTVRNSERIKKIVEDFRSFARRDEGGYNEEVDVNTTVAAAIGVIEHSLRKSTKKFGIQYGRDIPAIKGNIQRLEQVIINLLNNARQSLSDDQKAIAVETSYDPQTRTVLISIRDEGCGIDQKTLQRLFEPFYTTKTPTEGTGLGLSICNRIIRGHGGKLEFDSQVGRGTTAKIILPVKQDSR